MAKQCNVEFITIVDNPKCNNTIFDQNYYEYNAVNDEDKILIKIVEDIINKYSHNIVEIDLKEAKKYAIEYSKGKIEYTKSLANINEPLVKEWDYDLNGNLTPNDVVPGSHKIVHWICSNNHKYEARIYNRAVLGHGCPYCSHQKAIVGQTDLQSMNPKLASEWHPTLNKDIKPTDVGPSSTKKVWWLCNNGHAYQADIAHRNIGRGCPYCARKKAIIGENDLATTHPILVKEWLFEKNENLKPTDIKAGSRKKVWWKCSKCGYEWQAIISNRANKGSGCPKCYRKRRSQKLDL